MNYQSLYDTLLARLRSVRTKELNVQLISGVFSALGISLAILLALICLEALLFSGTVARTSMAAVWLVGTIAAFVYWAGAPLAILLGIKKKVTEEELALRVGKAYPGLGDKLLNALQLYHSEFSQMRVSRELALANFATVGAEAEGLDFRVIVNEEPRKRALLIFSGIALFSVLLLLLFPHSLGSAFNRLVHYSQSFIPPAPFVLEIAEVEQRVARGGRAEIRILAARNKDVAAFVPPTEILLRLRERALDDNGEPLQEGQETFDSYTLRADSAGVFLYELPSVKRGVEFYAEVPWYVDIVRSVQGRIVVVDKPDIRSLTGNVTPPSYTKTPPRSLDENTASIMSVAGSRVDLSVLSSKPLQSAQIVLIKRRGNDSARVDTAYIGLSVNDRRATGGFTVNFQGEYFLRLTDKTGEHNENPIRYSVLALADAMPTISMLQPLGDVELTESGLLPMKFTVSDDYGFSALSLHYRRTESRYSPPQQEFTVMKLPIPLDKAAEVPLIWDLNRIGIAPSDGYEFYLQVTDNDIVTGPKSSRTQVMKARLPSLDEIFRETDKTQEVVAKELQKILKEADQMKREAEEASRELRKQQEKPQADWKEKKRLDDLLKKQEDFAKRVDDVQKQLEQMTEKLQQNQSISEETLKQYMEVQKLLKQVNSPELQKAMQQMQRALDQMQPEQMQQALQKFQFNEEDFKRSIERTMKILQRVQANQKADELTKRAQELEEKQRKLEKQMENTNTNDKQKREQLAQQQERLKEDLQNMEKELADLEQLMKEIQEKGGRDMPMDEMKKAQEALKKDETENAMQEAEKQMREGNQQQAKQQQQKAQQNLQQFAQQMKNLKKEMQRNVQQEAIRQMQKATHNMLELSKRQEQLKQQSQTMDYNSTQFRDAAQEQANALQDLKNVIGRMVELSQKSFAVTPEMGKELGEAMQQMENATQSLEDRNAQQAQQQQNGAMSAMNRAVMQMQSMLGQMQQGEGGSGQQGEQGDGMGQQGSSMGFMESLQRAAAQQQALNQQLQEMMQQQGGQRLGQEQGGSEQVGRMAAQQEAIRKSLEELSKKEQTGGKKALGSLDKLAQEMQEIVQDMKSGNISEETLRRQERILSRLLDASRSTREQDFEKQREAKSAINVSRTSPGAIDLSTQEGKNRALEELLRNIKQGYTKDYEVLIRKYFEALQKTEVQQ